MPSEAEIEKMQTELSRLDPSALPADLREMIKGVGDGPNGPLPSLEQGFKGLSGLPGLGGGKPVLPGLGGQPFRGFPGPGMKKK